MSFRTILLSALVLHPWPALAVSIATVPVRDVGNPVDQNPFSSPIYGSVGYAYRIGQTEVTNSQYVEFLNSVARADPYGLYNPTMAAARGGITRSGVSGNYNYAVKSNMGNKPVNYVNLFDAMRFTNWLHNGQGAGSTENGAYALNGIAIPGPFASSIQRKAGAQWFVPSQDEWYKAAYYQPSLAGGDVDGYWHYATRSNELPTKAFVNSPTFDIANPGVNVANYDLGISFQTSVGSAGPLSASYYGTYDQSGNVEEWTDSTGGFHVDGMIGTWRRGGSFNDSVNGIPGYGISIQGAQPSSSTTEFSFIGFRVGAIISVPEPDALPLSSVAIATLVVWGLGRRKRTREPRELRDART